LAGRCRAARRPWWQGHYPNELCEAALAHTIADKVEAAYRRGDLFDKRRQMMDEWAKFLAGRRK